MKTIRAEVMLNNLVSLHGHEWVVDLIENLTIFHSPLPAIAERLGVKKCALTKPVRRLFEEHDIGGETLLVLRPEARAQFDLWESVRAKRISRILEQEARIHDILADPSRLPATVKIDHYPGASEALSALRAEMGEREFKTFLHQLRSDRSIFQVADRFKNFGVRSTQVMLWRQITTEKHRALIPALANLITTPLSLLKVSPKPAKKAKGMKPEKGAAAS